MQRHPSLRLVPFFCFFNFLKLPLLLVFWPGWLRGIVNTRLGVAARPPETFLGSIDSIFRFRLVLIATTSHIDAIIATITTSSPPSHRANMGRLLY